MLEAEIILKRLTEAVEGTDKELFTEEELNRFASFYVDKWDNFTSEDVIAESFVDYWWNNENNKTVRRCTICGHLFREGYCHNDGENYYCSDECLRKDFTKQEWIEECNTNPDSYYTIW